MNALLVGADKLGNIPEILKQYGISITSHVNGRDSAHQRRCPNLPAGIELVILFTDFLGHNVMQRFKDAATRQNAMLICCRRSACALQDALGKRITLKNCQSCYAKVSCERKDKRKK